MTSSKNISNSTAPSYSIPRRRPVERATGNEKMNISNSATHISAAKMKIMTKI